MEREATGPVEVDDVAAGCASMELKIRADQLNVFFPLLQRGVTINAPSGRSVRQLLCEELGIADDYVTGRITTIFLDNRPLDDLDSMVRDGARLTLSAAMPGLVGATMRRSGFYAAFRAGITHTDNGGAPTSASSAITLKLFNLLLPELGPLVLSRGILLQRHELDQLLGSLSTLWMMSSEPTGPGQTGPVFLTVAFLE